MKTFVRLHPLASHSQSGVVQQTRIAHLEGTVVDECYFDAYNLYFKGTSITGRDQISSALLCIVCI